MSILSTKASTSPFAPARSAYCDQLTLAVNFSYDARHNPLTKSSPSSSYTYDNLNRLISTGQGGQNVATAYDALGRVTSVTGPLGSVGYMYDAGGRRTRLTWPDGFYVTYEMDNTGAVKTISENGSATLVSFTYDDLGRRQTLARGGATTTYQYDPASRLQSLTNDLPGTAQDQILTFSYNPAGQITSRSSNNAVYAFQDNYNLDKAAPVNGLNQYTAYGTSSLAYDGRGNLTFDGVNTFTYDLANRLTGTVSGPTPITSLAYDPLDHLYQVTASGGTATKFAYDGDDMIGEYNSSGTLLRRYVHGPATDEPLVVYTGSGTSSKSYYVADQQGSIVAKTDGSSTSVLAYDEYGVRQSAPDERYGYTGQIWIGELGLYHYKARTYSANLGRFMQADPIGYGDGPNIYAYVHGDPVNGRDPSGTSKVCTTVTGSRIPVCVGVDGNGDGNVRDNDLTGLQIERLGHDFHDFIASHGGTDLSSFGKTVFGERGVDNSELNMLRAVSQFVGAALSNEGGRLALAWSSIRQIDVYEYGSPRLGWAGGMAAAALSVDQHYVTFTGTMPNGVDDYWNKPSELARTLIHEINHWGRSNLWELPLMHEWGVDWPARRVLHKYGLDGGCHLGASSMIEQAC